MVANEDMGSAPDTLVLGLVLGVVLVKELHPRVFVSLLCQQAVWG